MVSLSGLWHGENKRIAAEAWVCAKSYRSIYTKPHRSGPKERASERERERERERESEGEMGLVSR